MSNRTPLYSSLGTLTLGHTGLDLLKGKSEIKSLIHAEKRRTLLIGWDAADWLLINKFRAKGIMPTLDHLIRTGVSGKISTLDPPFSPMLWTSIATGKTADKHGILGFFEKRGDEIGPIRSLNRATRAFWNIFTYTNKHSNIINWWPSDPVEKIKGTMVSNHYFKGLVKGQKNVEVSGTLYPKELQSQLSKYLFHVSDLTQEQVQPFFPQANQKTLDENEKLIENFQKLLAACVSVHSHSTFLIENTHWDFTAVYLETIDHACHGFMKFFPPKLSGLNDDLYNSFKYVVEGTYRFHDMMLERLLNLSGPNTDVILLSDHGFHSNHLRPTQLPKFDAAPALEHSPFGVLVMNGPSFKKGTQIHGSSLLDITPTLLHLNKLPIGRDMNGRVLKEAFAEDREVEYIPSWDKVEGNFGEERIGKIDEDKELDDETLQQLIELGYIDAKDKSLKDLSHKAEFHHMYNLARVYMSKNEYGRAIFILNDLVEKEPDDIRYNLSLISSYLAVDRPEEARKLFEKFKKETEDKGLTNLMLTEAKILQKEEKHQLAIQILDKARQIFKKNPNISLELGFEYLLVKNYNNALNAFKDSLKLNPNNARAYLGLGMTSLRKKDYEAAIENCLNAIDLTFNFPKAHAILGEALEDAGMFQEAAEAYENCLKMTPHMRSVRERLMLMYKNKLNMPAEAQQHEAQLEKSQGEIVVVSGLPRSGTSMMMQMLHKGGMPVLTDEVREADKNNPKGYYEYEAVKSLATDAGWMPEAENKAVKIVLPLLRYLPRNYRYKVIFMKRDLGEIIPSQQIMLNKDPKNLPIGLFNAYQQQLENLELWKKLNPSSEILEVRYEETVENPEKIAHEVIKFLGKGLDAKAMAVSVDAKLYRNRVTATKD